MESINSCDWETLEQMVRTKGPQRFVEVCEMVSRSSQLNGMTILHACIRFDPPPRVVQLIIRLSPSSPFAVDCLNRTPLHIAAAIRANPQSIMLLVDACQKACSVRDVDGKTPLHFACDKYW